MREETVVSVESLRKTYDETVAVEDVSFDIESESVVGLLGHNGAGKTTTIKMILGIITPTAGQVHVCGEDVTTDPRPVYDRVAAVLEGTRNVYWRLTVRENLRFFARLGGYAPDDQRAYHDELLEKLEIEDRADSVVNELSTGMKQKVSLAAGLARKPDVLFLDEPTLGLDVESSRTLQRELERLVSQEEMTVIVSSHDMDVIEELCDRVIIMSNGSVIADDSVENLYELFRSQSLRLTLEGDVPARLTDERAVGSLTQRDGRTEVELSMTDAEQLRRLLGELTDAGVQLVDIETTRVDFEEIYLEITEQGGRR